MNALLVVALVIALVIIVWLYAYKVRHKYTEDDLAKARKDSLARSRSVVSGKVQEYLAPLFPEFISQFNPRDARFLGTPLDFVVFDGMDEDDVRRIVFVEVKTGKASLSTRERHVRNAIEAGHVEYQLLHLPNEVAPDSVPSTDAAPDVPPALQS